jgi:hypothetical protein
MNYLNKQLDNTENDCIMNNMLRIVKKKNEQFQWGLQELAKRWPLFWKYKWRNIELKGFDYPVYWSSEAIVKQVITRQKYEILEEVTEIT